jgi:hypothetical protein
MNLFLNQFFMTIDTPFTWQEGSIITWAHSKFTNLQQSVEGVAS